MGGRKSIRVTFVRLMSTVRWLERTSGVFNYAAPGPLSVMIKEPRLSLGYKAAVHVFMSPPAVFLTCVDGSRTSRWNKDLTQMQMCTSI